MSPSTARSLSAVTDIKVVLEQQRDALMALPGVVGAALGEADGEPCIRVFVERRTPEVTRGIPRAIDGYRVLVQESGGFRALD